jgi:hypothetical protein
MSDGSKKVTSDLNYFLGFVILTNKLHEECFKVRAVFLNTFLNVLFVHFLITRGTYATQLNSRR